MSDHTVYLAEAGPKQESAVFEQVEKTQANAQVVLNRWQEACTDVDAWWFSVTEMGLTVKDNE